MTIERRAQQAVLDALLSGTALPGGVQPLLFPDFPGIAEAASVVLLDAGDPPLHLPSRVQVHSSDALPAAPDSDPPVLEFVEPEPFSDRVGVRLAVSRMDQRAGLLPLGEIVVTFSSTTAGDLVVTDPTHVVAY